MLALPQCRAHNVHHRQHNRVAQNGPAQAGDQPAVEARNAALGVELAAGVDDARVLPLAAGDRVRHQGRFYDVERVRGKLGWWEGGPAQGTLVRSGLGTRALIVGRLITTACQFMFLRVS